MGVCFACPPAAWCSNAVSVGADRAENGIVSPRKEESTTAVPESTTGLVVPESIAAVEPASTGVGSPASAPLAPAAGEGPRYPTPGSGALHAIVAIEPRLTVQICRRIIDFLIECSPWARVRFGKDS